MALLIVANILLSFKINKWSSDLFNIFSSCFLFGGLNVYISQCFKYIGTIKPDGGGRQYKTLYSNLLRTKEKAGVKPGWRLNGGFTVVITFP